MKFIVRLTAAIGFAAGTSAIALALPGARNIIYDSDHPEGIAYPVAVNGTASTKALSIRANSHWYLYTCYDPNYHGKCLTWAAEEGFCYNFSPEWANQISSISADAGIPHECTIYEDLSCHHEGKEQTFNVNGSADLRELGMDDKAKSYMCKHTSSAVIIPVTA